MNPFNQDAQNNQQQQGQQNQNFQQGQSQVIEGTATEVLATASNNEGLNQDFTRPADTQQQQNTQQEVQQQNTNAQNNSDQNVQQNNQGQESVQQNQNQGTVQQDNQVSQQNQNGQGQQVNQGQNFQQNGQGQNIQQNSQQNTQQGNFQQNGQQGQNFQQNNQQGNFQQNSQQNGQQGNFQQGQQNNQLVSQQTRQVAQHTAMPMGGEVSFDDEVKLSKLEKLGKMREGETRRIAFLLVNENGAPVLLQSQVFSEPVTHRSYRAPENPLFYKKFVEKFGEPKPRFGTIVAEYDTNFRGEVQSDTLILKAWTFGQDKWPDLKQLHKEWGLGRIDLTMTCKEEGFQKLTFLPTPQRFIDSMIQSDAQAYNQLVNDARDLYNSKHMLNLMGKILTEAEIIAMLNGQTSNAGSFGQGGGGNFGNPSALGGGGSSNPFNTAPTVNGNGAAPNGAAFQDFVQNS